MEKENIRVLNFSDKIGTRDEEKRIYTSTEKQKNKPKKHVNRKPKFYTEVMAYNELGEPLYTEPKHNELLLSGGLFTLAKAFNVDPPINIKTLNQDLGLLPDEDKKDFTGPRREDCVCLFGVGVGGAGETVGTIIPVKFKERQVKGLIPIRKVRKDEPLKPEEEDKYYCRVENGEYYDYYLKTFETKPVIKVLYDEPGEPEVPEDVDLSTDDTVIDNYIEIHLKISEEDVREYFRIDGEGEHKALINTLGLYYGYPVTLPDGRIEYKGLRVFSMLDFDNEPLTAKTKEIHVVYKIFIG